MTYNDDVAEITLYDRYGVPVLAGVRICECGAVVADTEAHDRFHAALAAQRRHT